MAQSVKGNPDDKVVSDAPATVPTPPEVLDASALVESILHDVAGLTRVRHLEAHVAALISSHRMNVPLDEALAEPKAAGIKDATLRPGIEAMKKAANTDIEAAVNAFNEKAGVERE